MPLSCEECREESEVDEREPGWRAYILPAEDRLDDGRRVILYCPACAVREFGRRRDRS